MVYMKEFSFETKNACNSMQHVYNQNKWYFTICQTHLYIKYPSFSSSCRAVRQTWFWTIFTSNTTLVFYRETQSLWWVKFKMDGPVSILSVQKDTNWIVLANSPFLVKKFFTVTVRIVSKDRLVWCESGLIFQDHPLSHNRSL